MPTSNVKKAPYQLLIFDWDGTLMDSLAYIIHCVKLAAIEHELEPPAPAHVRNLIGLGVIDVMEKLFPSQSYDLYLKLLESYRKHFFSPTTTTTSLFPNVIETLTELKSQGYLLAVATAKSRYGLNEALLQTRLGHLMDSSRCADETASKPHPLMLLELLEELDISPDAAIMVGDTAYDLEMARNAKVDSLGVSYGAHSKAQLMAHQPRHIFDEFGEILFWLESQNKI